ncbi:MAG TPA: hypothetical protein VE959_15830 [Bryobacteraceae bacterium]|nr:hypothetical protein [Bryobacteraceae bacterium]
MEIQNQDSHFSTAQISLRRKEKNGRLHKTLDTPTGLRRMTDAGFEVGRFLELTNIILRATEFLRDVVPRAAHPFDEPFQAAIDVDKGFMGVEQRRVRIFGGRLNGV